MIVKIPVIGIPAWPWKKKLYNLAKKRPNIVNLEITDFCFELQRHAQILDVFDKNNIDFKDTEYYRYQQSNKKSHDDIISKISRFQRLYKDISLNGYDNSLDHPIVTIDGCRLDGSHRLAVLLHLNISHADINVLEYDSFVNSKEVKKITKQVSNYRKEEYSL